MPRQLWTKSRQRKTGFLFEPVLYLNKVPFTTSNRNARSILNNTNDGNSKYIGGDLIALCKQGRLKEALDVFCVMDYRGIRADSSAYAALLQECVNRKALVEGKLLHAHIIDTGLNPDIFLQTKLVIMYAKCGSLADARRVLDGMAKRNVVSWNAMIAAYARHGYGEEALALFYRMRLTGIQPDHFTLASVLPACADMAALEHGKKVHEAIIKGGFEYDVFVGSALVGMYVHCGIIDDARQVFDKMSERDVVLWTAMIAAYAQSGHVEAALELFQKMGQRDVVSWNAMIAGYAQNGHVEEALKLFQKMGERDVISWNAMIGGYAQNGYFSEALKSFKHMQLAGVKPNCATYPNVLPACANLAALEHGKKVHGNIIRNGLESYVYVGNALVDMYAKCGGIEDAGQVFDKMPKRSVISWNALIVGYAMHGRGKEALQLFEQMQQSCEKTDRVTFIGVLSACCHAGLVDDGWRYFTRMSQDYHVIPGLEHYCCMVDLLGRAGCLDEAREFIDKMPIKPNAAVWGSLLGACRIHTNIEVGQLVADHLFELDPTNAAHYVLLSNIYAAAGRWDDVEKVREVMKIGKVIKQPGCSWTEVNNEVYSFCTGNRSHPHMHEIYEELERLTGQMKEVGYVPDKSFVLHDVEEEQKEHILCHHSEKLAIVFGLLHTSPGTPIRIVKNLRVCGDCHSAAKFIAKIVTREIVVRDANRFHHFKDGQCSCGDYW